MPAQSQGEQLGGSARRPLGGELKRFSPAGARAGRIIAAVTLGTLVMSGSAAAAVKQRVSAAKAVARSCHESYVGGAGGAATVRAKAPADGLVLARLAGAGDWDLGVFDAKTKRYVAGSAGFRSNELAEGFVRKGQKLVVQACRYRGDAASARVSVSFLETGAAPRTPARRSRWWTWRRGRWPAATTCRSSGST